MQLSGESLLPWFLTVARRVASHRWRAALRHRAALSRMPVQPAVPDHADEVADRLDDRADLDRASRALRQLSAADRDVLAVCVWQGLGYADAAVALGVPVGTVRSRLHRARARLRALAEDGTAPDRAAGDPVPRRRGVRPVPPPLEALTATPLTQQEL